MYIPTCMSVYHLHTMRVEARSEHQIPMEPKSQQVVSCRVSAGNQTMVLWQSNKCS